MPIERAAIHTTRRPGAATKAMHETLSPQQGRVDAGADETARRRLRALERVRGQHAGAPGARSGWLRASVFGINDGLISKRSLVAGVSAAAPGRDFILPAGLAGRVAGAFSMGAGEHVSTRAQREVFEALIAQERWRLRHRPDEERLEAAVIHRAKGIPSPGVERLADEIMRNPGVALDLMARKELGLDPEQLGSPRSVALGSFLSFALGAAVPVLPCLALGVWGGFLSAVGLAAAAIFAVGALTAHLSARPRWRGGARMLFIGALAAGVTYAVGRLVGASVAVG